MTLRRRNSNNIRRMFQRFGREVEGLIDTAISLSWFMRGGLQYHDAYDLTPIERERMHSFITERLEKEFKKMNPVY